MTEEHTGQKYNSISFPFKSFNRNCKWQPGRGAISAGIVCMGILLIATSGCVRKNLDTSLPVDTTLVFSASGSQPLQDRWWVEFGDDQLNAFVDSALASNFNLRTAWERLQAANAVVERTSASFFPTLDADAQAEMSQPLSEFVETNKVSVGIASSYEVDLWGRIRSSVEAERYRAEATYYDYKAAAITLAGEVALAWYRLVEARDELQLVNDQVEINQQVLNLIKARFGSGQIRGVDILRQQQLVESTIEEKINIQARITVLQHQLMTLLGLPPHKSIVADYPSLPELPPLPKTGVPASLVQRRPDVLSAFHSLKAADRDLATAISSRYPRLSLTASVSSAADNINNLFNEWAYSLAGNLMAPIFYGGELKAEVNRTEAVKNQRIYKYAQVILTSFQEVEDALLREQMQIQTIDNLSRRVDLAKRTYEQLQMEYFNGMSDYLDVLSSLIQEQQLRRDLMAARLALVENRISLYRALAGGFDTTQQTDK